MVGESFSLAELVDYKSCHPLTRVQSLARSESMPAERGKSLAVRETVSATGRDTRSASATAAPEDMDEWAWWACGARVKR